jgi:hypothetical protein
MNAMNAARRLLLPAVLIIGAFVVAQVPEEMLAPKAGVYTIAEKQGSKIILTETKGGNFLVTGTLGGTSKITGTLFKKTRRLAANVSYDPFGKKEKRRTGPLDGYWDWKRKTIVITKMDGIKTGWDAVSITARAGEKLGDKVGRDKAIGDSKAILKKLNFTGTWDSSFGKMTLTQSGKNVSGTYDYYSGEVKGEIRADGNLYFTWTQKNPDKKGTGFFTLSSDGKSFSGSWDYTLSDGKPANNGGGWSGRRIQ